MQIIDRFKKTTFFRQKLAKIAESYFHNIEPWRTCLCRSVSYQAIRLPLHKQPLQVFETCTLTSPFVKTGAKCRLQN
jgi:hypothetical protein